MGCFTADLREVSPSFFKQKQIFVINMLALINRILDWFKSLFWKEEMELTLVGLQYSGKTTFVNVIASGQFSEDMIPTVGFNMRKITKGNVTIKLWDIGGQPRFRSMWERYCRGVNAIVYMVDAADQDKIEASRNELHHLLDKPQLAGIPVLVLGNKRDLPNALDENWLIERMNLSAIQDREICCYSISCKEKGNIDITLQWLITHSKSGGVVDGGMKQSKSHIKNQPTWCDPEHPTWTRPRRNPTTFIFVYLKLFKGCDIDFGHR